VRYAVVVCLCPMNYVFGADQAAEQWQRKMAVAREQVSQCAYGEAVESLHQALALAETFGASAVVLNNLAVIRHIQQRDLEVRQIPVRAADLLRHDFEPSHPLLGRIYHNLANMGLITAGQLYHQALENPAHFGPSHPTYLNALTDYAVF
jgi:hypothetical protein